MSTNHNLVGHSPFSLKSAIRSHAIVLTKDSGYQYDNATILTLLHKYLVLGSYPSSSQMYHVCILESHTFFIYRFQKPSETSRAWSTLFKFKLSACSRSTRSHVRRPPVWVPTGSYSGDFDLGSVSTIIPAALARHASGFPDSLVSKDRTSSLKHVIIPPLKQLSNTTHSKAALKLPRTPPRITNKRSLALLSFSSSSRYTICTLTLERWPSPL